MACATPLVLSISGSDKSRVDSLAMAPFQPASAASSDADASDADHERSNTRSRSNRSHHPKSSHNHASMHTKKKSRRHSNRAMSEAVKKKMQELDASGWRPDEEELANILDDEDYDAVDLVSDSEMGDDDNDDAIRRQEENFLLSMTNFDDEEEIKSAVTMDDMEAFDDLTFGVAQQSAFTHFLDAVPDATTLNSDPLSHQRQTSRDVHHPRVRFEDFDDVDSTDEEPRMHTFPDLLEHDHSLPGAFPLDDALHVSDNASDAGSCWDFEGDEMNLCLDDDADEDASCVSSSSDSAESEAGDTTDEEEVPPPPPPSLVKIKEKRPAQDLEDESRPSKAKRVSLSQDSPIKSAGLPVAGTFLLDPNRPVLLIDGSGSSQRNMFFPARIQSQADKQCWRRLHSIYSSRCNSPRNSVAISPDQEIDYDESMAPSEADSASVNPFFDGFGSLRADQVIGPPEAFMPFTSVDAAGSVVADTNESIMSGSEMGDEDYLDLVNLGDDSDDASDSETQCRDSDTSDARSWGTKTSFPPLGKHKSNRGGDQDLLSHLDRNRGLVGSFRRNQQLAKHVGSLASHPSLRASTLEMNAMQSGRWAAANTPITPLRKKRAGGRAGGGSRRSPVHHQQSPLGKVVTKKRAPPRGAFGYRR